MHHVPIALLLAGAARPPLARSRRISPWRIATGRPTSAGRVAGHPGHVAAAAWRAGVDVHDGLHDLLDPDLDARDREYALLHEVGHSVHGHAHKGPMAYPVLAEVPCVAQRLMQQRVKARWLAEQSPQAKAWWPQ